MTRTLTEHEERLTNYRRIHKESSDRLAKIADSITKLQSQLELAKSRKLSKFDDETFGGV